MSGAGGTELLALEALRDALREQPRHPDAIAMVDARLAALRYEAE